MKNNKVIVLDFDGVILDCKFEKLFTGFNAYYSVNKKSQLFECNPLEFSNFSEVLSKHSKTVSNFFSMLPFIGIAGENACAFDIIENENIIPSNHQSFITCNKIIDKTKYIEYNNKVNNIRKTYYTHHLDDYNNIVNPFQSIVDKIKNTPSNINIEICTAKSIDDVTFWNNNFGIQNNIHNITSVDHNQDGKVNALINISAKYKLKNSDIHFVDDLAINLLPAIKMGFNCYLSNWGYENNESKKMLKSMNIKIINQSEFNELIDEISG